MGPPFSLKMKKILNKIEYLWMWIKCHTYKKFHLIDLRQPEGDYDWGYIDPMDAIELAVWKIFAKFYEGGCGYTDWDYGEPWIGAKKEMDLLYKLWKVELPRRKKELDEAWNEHCKKYPLKLQKDDLGYLWPPMTDEERVDFNILNKLEEGIQNDQDEALIRIMKIRRYLWD